MDVVGASNRAGPATAVDLFTQVRELWDESERPLPMSPERIGDYELVFKLASGGMADVFLARSKATPGLNQVVALKRIHRHLVGEPGYREMFLDEARIAFQISHRNVCPVFDFGESYGEHYLAMEYLVGEPMARLLNRLAQEPDRWPPSFTAPRLAHMIAGACAGLHAAHNVEDARGNSLEVVHRDVTPRNLFLTYGGATKVLDFGIATARMKSHAKRDGDLRGNLAYMAPEQLTGGPIDRRADIWALGVTFWEMLAMNRLFRRSDQKTTASAVLYDDIPSPAKYLPSTMEELGPIVLKAMRRDPDERWQTAHEMGLAIRRVLHAQPEVIGPADLSEWMNDAFPFGEARKRQLIRIARVGSSGGGAGKLGTGEK